LVAVENEGNVALGVSHPAKHIVVTGLEKIVAEDEDALAILEVLAPSATAQPLTAFTHLLGDPPPGQERHVVFVDNGRSEILANERYRDILRCIRCGACMNACPVYTVAGGLAYGSPYMGPVGAVLSPLLWPEGGFSDLPGASSLCGRCSEVCPVGIPIHRMLLDLRADDGYAQTTGFAEKAAWKLWAATYGDPARARIAGTSGRVLARLSSALPFVSLPLGAATEERARARREPRNEVAYSPDPAPEAPPNERIALLIQRLQDLGVKVVPQKPSARDGDRVLGAAAAVAGTGSLLLTGSSASRREILAAERVIVRVDPGTVVDHPNALAPYISDGQDSLILTGASRTADIEKQIVRGIHGTEELVVVVGPTSSHRESEIPVTPGGR
jgi:ferredoxin